MVSNGDVVVNGVERLCSASLALLVLLARRRLEVSQREAALALCAEVTDWPALFQEARRHFVLPLIYRHLRELGAALPEAALAQARRATEQGVMLNMKVVAAQQRLLEAVLVPLGVRYLLFKGPSLAARYYDEPGFRQARDIDLLVHDADLPRVLEQALQVGYRPANPETLYAGMPALELHIAHCAVVTLVSPEGVAIEFHRVLDKTRLIYSTSRMLARAESARAQGHDIRVMPLEDLFVYICLHHTRHFWSHLHWLVDLDMLKSHADFDRAAVMQRAQELGLEATVVACLEMQGAAGRPLTGEALAGLSGPGRELLLAMLDALQGDRQHELSLRKLTVSRDFAFDWQVPPGHLWRWRWRQRLDRLTPNFHDYRALPLPRALWGLYYMIHPFRLLWDRVAR